MISEQYITFKTANLAKERGFTLQTIGAHVYNYYENDGKEGYVSWGHLNTEKAAKAPQNILQTWLREEHNIDLWFGMLNDPNKYHVEDIVKNNIIIGGVTGGSETYEEALKLI